MAAAEAGQRAALANYERAVINAFADVDLALGARGDAVEQAASQERLVKALAEYSELARLLFDGGYAPYSTVLQAEQQFFPAQLDLASARAQSLAATVSIYRAMGGGWVETASNTAPQPQAGAAPFWPRVTAADAAPGSR